MHPSSDSKPRSPHDQHPDEHLKAIEPSPIPCLLQRGGRGDVHRQPGAAHDALGVPLVGHGVRVDASRADVPAAQPCGPAGQTGTRPR